MPTGSDEPARRTPSSPAPSPAHSTKHGLHRYGFVLGRTLGSGAYAKVKAGHSYAMNKTVAIKIVNKTSAPNEIASKFLTREIETLKAMDHENVTKLYRTIITESETFLVLEYAEKGDLLDYINARRYLAEDIARKLFSDLVSGLSACHDSGIVHRDLKCENLLLNAQLRLKISDFGFARRQDKGANLETYCGSLAYAAPEVVLGEPYDGKPADVWSAGVVLYAMVSGRLPFKDNDIKKRLTEIASKLSFRPSVSEDCKNLVRGMLTFSVGDRLTLELVKTHPWMQSAVAKEPVRSPPPPPGPGPAPIATPTVEKREEDEEDEEDDDQEATRLLS